MIKILVSACLMGQPVRFDGNHKLVNSDHLSMWQEQGRLIPVCPETSGGLPTPRPPAEAQGGDGAMVLAGQARVMTDNGHEVTDAFLEGARATLTTAQANGARMAILKARSPSCGNAGVYDGSFSKRLIEGMGVTTALLRQNGIEVFSEEQIEQAAAWLDRLESESKARQA